MKEVRQQELAKATPEELNSRLEELRAEFQALERQVNRSELVDALVRHRARGLLGVGLSGAKLDRRLEELFESIRAGRLWPVSEVVRVIDGLIGRVLWKRIWLGVLALAAAIPAVVTIFLLAGQNQSVLERNRIQSAGDSALLKRQMLDLIYSESFYPSALEPEHVNPRYHRRLRSEAISTYIALEKEGWTEQERTALPPIRFVSLENANFRNMTIANFLGLLADQSVTGVPSRVSFEGSDLTGAKILGLDLSGSSFRGVTAHNLWCVSRAAKYTDFTGIDATNSLFDYSASETEPLDLTGAIMEDGNFTGCQFTLVYFNQTSLRNAKFSGAAFDECYFFNCDLSGADIRGVDFSNGNHHETVITGALVDEGTKWPEISYIETDPETGEKRVMTDKEKLAEREKARAAAEPE